MIINPIKEKKELQFLKGLVSLYEENKVTTVYDYDECSFVIDGDYSEFPDYNGEGFIAHYPRLDKDGAERVREIGDRLFGSEIVKKIDNPEADNISEADTMRYNLKCYVYPDTIKYVVVATAYNERLNRYEEREKAVAVTELFQ